MSLEFRGAPGAHESADARGPNHGRSRVFARRLIAIGVSTLFALAQPITVDAAPQSSAGSTSSVKDGVYTELMNYVRDRNVGGGNGLTPSASGLSTDSLDADFSLLREFVRSQDDATPGAADLAGVPNDQTHAGFRAAGPMSTTADAPILSKDELAKLHDFTTTKGVGAAPADGVHSHAKASGVAPTDGVHSHIANPDADQTAVTDESDLSALCDFAKTLPADAPIVVAAATAKAVKPKAAAAADDGPATYVGSQACVKCHRNQVGSFVRTAMGEIMIKNPRSEDEKKGCESCHGPGSKHIKSGETDGGAAGDIISFRKDSPRPVEERNAICLSCHEHADRTNWSGSAHETRGLACTNCHQIMEKVSPKFQLVKGTELETCFQCHKDRRAQAARSSHMPLGNGDMTCSSCHNPHGSATDSLLREASVNETCYKCHADKRGPFLWEHAPVRDSCLNCHTPHGTNNEYLLKVQRPRLCQQCHQGVGHGNPGNPMTVQAVNRSCNNCHTMVHGSNSPAGALLQR